MSPQSAKATYTTPFSTLHKFRDDAKKGVMMTIAGHLYSYNAENKAIYHKVRTPEKPEGEWQLVPGELLERRPYVRETLERHYNNGHFSNYRALRRAKAKRNSLAASRF